MGKKLTFMGGASSGLFFSVFQPVKQVITYTVGSEYAGFIDQIDESLSYYIPHYQYVKTATYAAAFGLLSLGLSKKENIAMSAPRHVSKAPDYVKIGLGVSSKILGF